MRSAILLSYAHTLEQAGSLVADVPDEDLANLPHEGAKHPAWVLSHLCVGSGFAAALLGSDPSEYETMCGVPGDWAAVSAPGTEPQDDRSIYASKKALLAELTRVHDLAAGRFEQAPDDLFTQDLPMEDYRAFWPTIGDATVYLLARHEPWHLGQLSAWRQAAGLGPAPRD